MTKEKILEEIKRAVDVAKKIPGSKIEYNFDLPENADFGGIEAVFNKNVVEGKCNVIYKY